MTLTRWCVAAVLCALAPISTQERPNLSGIWVAVKDTPATLPAAPSAILGARMEIRHKDNAFTFVRPRGTFSIEATYEIGGPEVRLRSPGTGCQGDAYFFDRASWDGATLVFTATGLHSAGAAEPSRLDIKRLIRLEGPDTLVVEGTITQAGKPSQVGTVYKRSTEALPPLAPTLPATKAAAKIDAVAWVAGTWASDPAAAAGTTTEERWTPPAGGVMLALGRTLRGSNMSAHEFLCIAERDGSLVYNAMPNGRAPATEFVLTHLSTDSATFENPSHDYPKVIKYTRRSDGSLETAISGAPNQRTITVVLKKQQ